MTKKHTTGFHQGKPTHENTTTTPQTIQQLKKNYMKQPLKQHFTQQNASEIIIFTSRNSP
jgi:hypothetical protein